MDVKDGFVVFNANEWKITNMTTFQFARKIDNFTYEYCVLNKEALVGKLNDCLSIFSEDYEKKVFALLNGKVKTQEIDWKHFVISINNYDSDYIGESITWFYKKHKNNVDFTLSKIQLACQAIFERNI